MTDHLSPSPEPPRVMTAAEVAALARCTAATLTTWVAEGKFPPPLRLGRKRLWSRAVVERHLFPEQATGAGGVTHVR